MSDNDYAILILTKDELKALKSLKLNEDYLPDTIAQVLLDYELIYSCTSGTNDSGFPIFNGKYKLNKNGQRYLVYHSEHSKTKFYELIRYIITTLIAITALIISLLKS